MLADLGNPRGGATRLDRFTVRSGARQLILRAERILWFGAEDKLVFAATALGRPLGELHARSIWRSGSMRRASSACTGARS